MRNNAKLLEAYVSDQLSIFERIKFEEKLENDEKLRRELALYKTLRSHIIGNIDLMEAEADPSLQDALKQTENISTDLGDKKLRAFIDKNIHNARRKKSQNVNTYLNETDTRSRQNKRRILFVASSIAAAILSMLVIKMFIVESSGKNLFDKYYTEYTTISYIQRGTTNSQRIFVAGIDAFKKQEYSEAINYFSQISSQNEHYYEDARFFLPMSYMSSKDFDTAGKLFEKYLEEHTKFHIEATWYLSLCYIRSNNFELATPLLEDLIAQESKYQRIAARLLFRIK